MARARKVDVVEHVGDVTLFLMELNALDYATVADEAARVAQDENTNYGNTRFMSLMVSRSLYRSTAQPFDPLIGDETLIDRVYADEQGPMMELDMSTLRDYHDRCLKLNGLFRDDQVDAVKK